MKSCAFVFLSFCPFGCLSAYAAGTPIHFDPAIPQLAFVAAKFQRALRNRGDNAATSASGAVNKLAIATSADTPAAGFTISSDGRAVRISGSKATETMHGGLELAEELRFGRDVLAPGKIHRAPFIAKRGIKFNFSLDARTPSYDDIGDSAQRNIEVDTSTAGRQLGRRPTEDVNQHAMADHDARGEPGWIRFRIPAPW